jgi:hypothetical protein
VSNQMGVAECVLGYVARGWKPIPIPAREKAPTGSGWQNTNIRSDEIQWRFSATGNVGVLLGTPSGIVDIDLDSKAAVKLAGQHLPPTGAIFGRPGKPRSHWIYRVANPEPTRRFQSPDREAIVEYRSTGAQTVFPPSIHPTGEQVRWDDDGEPTEVDGAALMAAVELLAEACRVGNLAFDATTVDPNPRETPIVDRCRAYLECLPDSIQGQNGSTQFLQAACECYRFGLADGDAFDLLKWFSETKSVPPWSDKDIRHKMTDGKKIVTKDGELGKHLAEDAPAEWVGATVSPKTVSPAVEVVGDGDAWNVLEAAETPAESQIPDHLLRPAGIVGDIANWITETAISPQPVLSLAAALATVGTILGRKVMTETGLRSNMYICGVARAGFGKEHPGAKARQLLQLTGDDSLIGSEEVTGDVAMMNALTRSPSILWTWDEYGDRLRAIFDKYTDPGLRAIASLLKKLFSKTGETYYGKEYASRERVNIVQPHVSVFGVVQPDQLHLTISPNEVTDGFLPRHIVLYTPSTPPRKRTQNIEPSAAPPDKIAVWVKAWHAFDPNSLPGNGNLHGAFISNPHNLKAATRDNKPMLIRLSPQAAAIMAEFSEQCSLRSEKTDVVAALYGRGAEHARKLALIVAAGCTSEPVRGVEVDAPTAAWACGLSRYALDNFAGNIVKHVAGNDFERDLKCIREIIRQGGNISRGRLTRATPRMIPQRRDQVITTLLQGSEIEKITIKPKRGPAAIGYRLAPCVAA